MATNILSSKRTKWITVKEFQEIYSLKTAQAYKLVNEPNFPKKKFGDKLIRINLNEAEIYIDKKYNWKKVSKMPEAQVRLIERRAVRAYKQKLKSKIQAVAMFITIETVFVAGVIYNLV